MQGIFSLNSYIYNPVTGEEKTMPRKKRTATPAEDLLLDNPDAFVEGTDDPAAIPAPKLPEFIDGPSAQELAAHGSDFMTQALLVKQHSDNPAIPVAEDIMPGDAVRARELMMILSMMGIGEVYVGSVQRMAGAMQALEKRVFSEEFLAKLTPSMVLDLYKLSVSEMDKRAKYMAGLLATVDVEAVRTKLAGLAAQSSDDTAPDLTPPPAKKKRGKKSKPGPAEDAPAAVVPAARPHPSVLLHQLHTTPEESY